MVSPIDAEPTHGAILARVAAAETKLDMLREEMQRAGATVKEYRRENNEMHERISDRLQQIEGRILPWAGAIAMSAVLVPFAVVMFSRELEPPRHPHPAPPATINPKPLPLV